MFKDAMLASLHKSVFLFTYYHGQSIGDCGDHGHGRVYYLSIQSAIAYHQTEGGENDLNAFAKHLKLILNFYLLPRAGIFENNQL